MPTTDLIHNRSRYRRLAAIIRHHANTNPATICWRCGLTLEQHQPHRNGRPARWTAGHLTDSQPAATLHLHDLAPEASTCNTKAGASYGNAKRNEPRSKAWR